MILAALGSIAAVNNCVFEIERVIGRSSCDSLADSGGFPLEEPRIMDPQGRPNPCPVDPIYLPFSNG
jgi:hypothetical protein